MKKLFLFTYFTFLIVLSYAKNDSSEVYLTKKSYLNNSPDYSSKFFIKEKFTLGWSGFSFQAEGIIRLKLNNDDAKNFLPGSVFGFYTNGLKYIYVDSLKKYLAVLTENNILNFYIGEKEKAIYKGILVDDIFYYSKEKGKGLKIFNKDNVNADFQGSKLLPVLLELLTKIKKGDFDKDMHRRQFVKAKKLIESTLL